MRFIVAGVLALSLAFGAFAQDGFFGSFIVGQKFVNLQALNDTLKSYLIDVEFPSHVWTIGGEGHMVVAKRFILGGKGFAFFSEKVVPKLASTDPTTRMKITGGLGIGSLGYALLCDPDNGVKLYPQVGVGLAPFLLQKKSDLASDTTFSSVITSGNDHMAVLEKLGVALDACVCMDWYMKFLHFLSIIPGLETGPLLHAEAGYTYIPGNLRWLRDIDQLKSFHPDMQFKGFYFNVGMGLGISSGSIKK